MFRVEIFAWVNGSGFSYNTTLDILEKYCTAEEYLKNLDAPIDCVNCDDILVKIFGEDQNNTDEPLSEFWQSDLN